MLRYKPEELFEVNETLKVQIVDIDQGSRALIIDDFYKNPYHIRELILASPVPIWKNTPDGLNWKEYFDCRHQLFHGCQMPYIEALIQMIQEYYTDQVDTNTFLPFITNVFQWIIDQPKNSIGNRVHADGGLEVYDKEGKELDHIISEGTMGCNIFFNTPDECHGGTAIYESKIFQSNSLIGHEKDYVDYMEGGPVHRGETGAQYYDTEWEKFWSIQEILPMAFNRCIMYEGHLFHGAYHVDNNFKNYPRLGQACFINTNCGK